MLILIVLKSTLFPLQQKENKRNQTPEKKNNYEVFSNINNTNMKKNSYKLQVL